MGREEERAELSCSAHRYGIQEEPQAINFHILDLCVLAASVTELLHAKSAAVNITLYSVVLLFLTNKG